MYCSRGSRPKGNYSLPGLSLPGGHRSAQLYEGHNCLAIEARITRLLIEVNREAHLALEGHALSGATGIWSL
jgi:hypothetical protein